MLNVKKNLRPTRHARDVMAERDVTWAEVVEVVDRPENVYTSRGDFVFQKGSLAVVVCLDGAVRTVLLRQDPRTVDRGRWTNDDARARTRRTP